MILQKEIIEIAENKRLRTHTIDKDWVLGHFLNAMLSFEDIRQNFVFKGGTALKKCYFNDYRFSEDLDFTLLNKNFVVDERFIQRVIKKTSENCGAHFHLFKQKFQKSDDEGQGYEIKIQYWGADHKPNQKPLPPNRWQTKIKLDISYSEKLLVKPEAKPIFHDYSDKELINSIVPVYSLDEVISEKLRSLIQRNRPRDIYDINYMSKLFHESSYPEIKRLLFLKAEDKNIEIKDVSDFVNEKKANGNKRAWKSSLGDHLPVGDLPDFDTVYINTKQFIERILNS
jgi:predicted nucleotidyltransferase component of viral defense system